MPFLLSNNWYCSYFQNGFVFLQQQKMVGGKQALLIILKLKLRFKWLQYQMGNLHVFTYHM